MYMFCKKCGEEIQVRYNHQFICQKCYMFRDALLKDRKKKYIYDFLSQSKCAHCWEHRPVVLEFHHTDGTQKEFCVSEMESYSIRKIQTEINKCQILCCNCHKIVTAKEQWRYKFLNRPEFNEETPRPVMSITWGQDWED